ncbi:MAG: histidine phosphatase family protein [Candidatus Pacebacteria bacterium]|nr:histidine phosphatase family protein [Candidatus Paceibacterota bacterium]
MNTDFKNKYFLLRHGKNIHQTEKQDIVYYYPDDPSPCELIEEGNEEARAAGILLKNKNIDLIFCSDVCRAKQTAAIVAETIGFDKNKIVYDERMRDINWGIFGGKTKAEAWEFYNGEAMKKFDFAPPEGESWSECQARMVKVLVELENKYAGKNILIVSHGDPLWLLESYIKGLGKEEALRDREKIINTGEVREI